MEQFCYQLQVPVPKFNFGEYMQTVQPYVCYYYEGCALAAVAGSDYSVVVKSMN